jgi:hypothetical protein
MAREVVYVACKVSMGIMCQLYDMRPIKVRVMGGGIIMEDQAFRRGAPVRLLGPAIPFGLMPNQRSPIVGGYRITPNVPAEFWEEWIKQNEELDAVVNGMIIWHKDMEELRAMCLDRKKELSGMQAIDVTPVSRKGRPELADPRIEKSERDEVSDVMTRDRDLEKSS